MYIEDFFNKIYVLGTKIVAFELFSGDKGDYSDV